MKIKYIKKNSMYDDANKFFTTGNEYVVLADYRQRRSGQKIRDNGFVVLDNMGNTNMVFENEVQIIDNDTTNVYTYEKATK